jgi:hypothetical protein
MPLEKRHDALFLQKKLPVLRHIIAETLAALFDAISGRNYVSGPYRPVFTSHHT